MQITGKSPLEFMLVVSAANGKIKDVVKQGDPCHERDRQ